MKQLPDHRLRREEERREHERKMQRTVTRNWIICIVSLAAIVLIYIFGR